MGILESVILGVVQGVAEFLPISSSAHLIIVSSLLGDKPLPLALNIALHVGTVGAVLLYFWRDWWRLAASLVPGEEAEGAVQRKLLLWLVVGSIPAGVVGVLGKDWIEKHLHHPLVTALPLALVGGLLWWVDRSRGGNQGELPDLGLKGAIGVGLAQACALLPGVSRSGATMLAGLMFGLNRAEAARYSFLLGTPAMLGAALLDFRHILLVMTEPIFGIGVLVSFVTGALTIHFLLIFLKRFGFASFAVYRLALSLVIAWLYWPF